MSAEQVLELLERKPVLVELVLLLDRHEQLASDLVVLLREAATRSIKAELRLDIPAGGAAQCERLVVVARRALDNIG